MTRTKNPWHGRFLMLLCALLLFGSICVFPAYAEDEEIMLTASGPASVTVSSFRATAYFQTYNTQGLWVDVGTPNHIINETGQVAYCLQTDKVSPEGSGYSAMEWYQAYDQTTMNGLRAILENGYPVTNGGFPDDQARYATANAIRFWLSERGAEGVPTWMNLHLNSQFFRGKPGHEGLYNWCLGLVQLARNQSVASHSISLSPAEITLTQEGDYFTGSTTVWLHNCAGGYSVDMFSVPYGTEIQGQTGNNGGTVTMKVPLDRAGESFSFYVDGIDNRSEASLVFYAPNRSNEQRVVAYTLDVYNTAAYTPLTVHVPEIQKPNSNLTVSKRDASNGTYLAGASFDLYDSAGNYLASGTTDANGLVTFGELAPGDYYVQETAAPTGYALNTERWLVNIPDYGMSTGTTSWNQKLTGSVTITKLDADSGAVLPGTWFSVYDSNKVEITNAPTHSGGYVTIPGLLPGEYYYREMKAPEGYEPDDAYHPFSITLDNLDVQVSLENRKYTGSIHITKADSGGNPLAGAEYALEASTDDGSTWSAAETLTTDESGTALFAGLSADGSTLYRVTETKAPPGFTLLADRVFEGTLPVEVSTGGDIEKDGRHYCYSVYLNVTDCPVFRLPNTGSRNELLLCSTGIALAGLSFFMLILRRKEME